MRALDRHWWAKLLLLQSSVNGFATAFGRPAQALCLKPSFLTCKTRYCHGLRSRVASWPLANCFIYRITAFGRVNCFLLLTVTSSSTLQQNCEPSYRNFGWDVCVYDWMNHWYEWFYDWLVGRIQLLIEWWMSHWLSDWLSDLMGSWWSDVWIVGRAMNQLLIEWAMSQRLSD